MSSAYVTTNGLAKSLGIDGSWLDRLKKAGVLEYDLPNVRMFNLEKAKHTYLAYVTLKLEKRNLYEKQLSKRSVQNNTSG